MELRQLTTFQLLARTLSFTRTAQALNYVQSTVTAQIQALEAELGVPLFDRLGKRVVLTAAGSRFLAYSERILGLVEEAQRALNEPDEPMGPLTLSASETVCIYYLPGILAAMRRRHPQVQLRFRPEPCGQQRRLVSEGSTEIAFVFDEPLAYEELQSVPLQAEAIRLVVAPEHPLAAASAVGPEDLRHEPLVLTEPHCTYRLKFERIMSAAGIALDRTLEFGNVEAIKQCVIAGMGIGVLPDVVVARECAAGRLVVLPWAGDDVTMLMQVFWHRDKWLSPTLRALLAITAEHFPAAAPLLAAATMRRAEQGALHA